MDKELVKLAFQLGYKQAHVDLAARLQQAQTAKQAQASEDKPEPKKEDGASKENKPAKPDNSKLPYEERRRRRSKALKLLLAAGLGAHGAMTGAGHGARSAVYSAWNNYRRPTKKEIVLGALGGAGLGGLLGGGIGYGTGALASAISNYAGIDPLIRNVHVDTP